MGNTDSQARKIPTAFEVIYNTSHPAKAIDSEQYQYANELLQSPGPKHLQEEKIYKQMPILANC